MTSRACLCIMAHNKVCSACFPALNYFSMVYKSLRNKISVHLRNSSFGFTTMNLYVKWHHLLTTFLSRFFICRLFQTWTLDLGTSRRKSAPCERAPTASTTVAMAPTPLTPTSCPSITAPRACSAKKSN